MTHTSAMLDLSSDKGGSKEGAVATPPTDTTLEAHLNDMIPVNLTAAACQPDPKLGMVTRWLAQCGCNQEMIDKILDTETSAKFLEEPSLKFLLNIVMFEVIGPFKNDRNKIQDLEKQLKSSTAATRHARERLNDRDNELKRAKKKLKKIRKLLEKPSDTSSS